jgi:hypothetical protein
MAAPELQWINTALENLKTSLSGGYHRFKFIKFATQYLGIVAYRLNRRFGIKKLMVAAI